MNHQEISEINFGLILSSRNPVTLYKPEWFCYPYNKGVELLSQPGNTKEDVAKVVSIDFLNDAHESVKRMNGLGEEVDWPTALRKAFTNLERGKILKKIGSRLENNEDVDMLPVYAEIGSSISNESSGLSLLADIDYNTYAPFQLTGYKPLDETIGGIPADGPIVIFGSSGVGKSKFVTGLIANLLKTHKEKTAAVYTLEMNSKHWAWRTTDLYKDILDVKDRLYVSGAVKDIEELVAEVTAKKVDYVVLDDIDNCVNSFDASEYERIFKRVKEVCRFMGIPFFVLAQITKEAEIDVSGGRRGKDGKTQGGRFLRRTDLAWSSSAWKSAALLLGLQTVWDEVDIDSTDYPLPSDGPLDYIIALKSRDGWMGDRDPKFQVGPGSVVLEHNANWTGKFYKGKPKLWTKTKRIGKD